MKANIIFGGWFFDENAKREQLPVVHNPSNEDIDRTLKSMRNKAGVVSMKNSSASESGPFDLTLYAEGGKYVAMLNERDENDDHVVRTLSNKSANSELTPIMGEMYPSKAVVNDLNLVAVVFKEFARSGNVSTSAMA